MHQIICELDSNNIVLSLCLRLIKLFIDTGAEKISNCKLSMGVVSL